MSECQFELDASGVPVCIGCRIPRPLLPHEAEVVGNDLWRIHRQCPAQPPLPSFFKRLGKFTVEAINHATRGFPTCTQQQIDDRLAHCRVCPHFIRDRETPDLGYCSECGGCKVRREEVFLNKLAWADQECPIGKWPRVTPTAD